MSDPTNPRTVRDDVTLSNPPSARPADDPATQANTTAQRRAGRSGRCVAVFLGLVLLILAADLSTKRLAFLHVADREVVDIHLSATDNSFWDRYPHRPIRILPGVLSLKLTTNTGAVFGIGQGRQWLFISVSVAAIGFIATLFARSAANARWLHLSLALILGGALGNLYDRVAFNAVRDFLWLLPDTGLWPWIFNLADVALVLGVCLLMLLLWFAPNPRAAAPPSPGSR